MSKYSLKICPWWNTVLIKVTFTEPGFHIFWTFLTLSAHSFCRKHENVFFWSLDIFLRWLIKVQTSDSDNEWQLVTTSDNEWWQVSTVTANDNEWSFRLEFSFCQQYDVCRNILKTEMSFLITSCISELSKITNFLRTGVWYYSKKLFFFSKLLLVANNFRVISIVESVDVRFFYYNQFWRNI